MANWSGCLPDYRRQGIASSLTSNLAIKIIDRGKVPFYCCAWSNLKSEKMHYVVALCGMDRDDSKSC